VDFPLSWLCFLGRLEEHDKKPLPFSDLVEHFAAVGAQRCRVVKLKLITPLFVIVGVLKVPASPAQNQGAEWEFSPPKRGASSKKCGVAAHWQLVSTSLPTLRSLCLCGEICLCALSFAPSRSLSFTAKAQLIERPAKLHYILKWSHDPLLHL
jgi:hypothetical protein